MKFRIIVLIFILNIFLQLLSQTPIIDSLQTKLESAKGIEKIDIQIELSKLFREQDFAKSLEIAENALEESQKIHYQEGQAAALRSIADLYYDYRESEKAISYYRKCIKIFSRLDNKTGIGYCYNAIGSIYIKNADYDNALDNLLKSLKKYEDAGGVDLKSGTLNNIGLVYKEIGNYEKALEYFIQAYESSINTEDFLNTCHILNNIGVIYNQVKQEDKAIDYYQQAIELAQKHGEEKIIAQCYNNIGNIFSKNGDFPKALEYYLKALEIKRKDEDQKAIVYPLINIGNVYIEQEKFQEAILYLEEALEISQKNNLKELSRDAFLSLSNVYEAQNKYQRSLKFFQLYSAYKDSIMNEQISEKISNIEIKFETEKKEKEIEIYKLQIEKRKLVEWRLYFIILIVIALAIILYFFYTLKSRSNKLLKKEISERLKAEEGLQKARDELELKVKERTSELAKTNEELQLEIKEHKIAEEMYRKYESIANTSKEFMTLINKDFIYEAVNDSYCQATNKSFKEIIGNSVSEIWGKKQFEKIIKPYMEKCFAGNEVHYQEWFHFSDFEKRYYDVAYYPYYNQNGKVSHTIVVTRDVTEQKLLENQLLRSERLAGIGELAAGVAHEIRNPVAIINSTAQYCKNKFNEKDEEIDELMEIFTDTSEKIDKTVKTLLEFAKPQQIEMRKGDILKVLKKVCGLIEGKCSKQNVETNFIFPDSLPNVYLDEDQLSGAFLNLMLNALDAMPAGGEIKVQVELNDDEIEIIILDSGIGISKENLKKIFNPFFTTKKSGTGLGLSLVHQGKINISSKLGKGTRILIKFPVYK